MSKIERSLLRRALLATVLVIVPLAACSGSRSSSRGSTTVDQCPEYRYSGSSYDEAREAQHTGDPVDSAYRTGSYGTRADGERPPEWWGRSDVNPCSTEEESQELSGPLLLDSSNNTDDFVDSDGD